jgi:4-aminobutyrate aminotransferase
MKQSEIIVKRTRKFCVETTFGYPLVIKNGKGVYLWDVDGRKYIDFTSNVCSCNIGYNHPEIMKVLKYFSKLGTHKIAGQDFYTKEQAELAEKLLKIVPNNLKKVFFTNSGAEAVENCLKFAYRKKGPLVGVSCLGAFHGRTLGALTFTFSKPVQKKNYPELDHERIKFCTNNEDQEIENIERRLRENKNIAFLIVESIQGEGGYNIASKRFLKMLRGVATNNDIPLIIDEIQTGMGRTGKWWAFEHFGVEPDIMAAAKSLQVGAAITSEKYDPKERGAVSSTWGGGSRIDLAVGLKTIEIIEKEKLLENSKKIGDYLLKRLREMEDSEIVSNARGLGLMCAFDLEEGMQEKLELICFKNGLLILGCGKRGIRLTPPITIKKDEIDKGIEILEKSLKSLHQ